MPKKLLYNFKRSFQLENNNFVSCTVVHLKTQNLYHHGDLLSLLQLPWALAVSTHQYRHQYQITRYPARLSKRKWKLRSPTNVWLCVSSMRNASLSIFPRSTKSANWIQERKKSFHDVMVREMSTAIFKWAEVLSRWLVEMNCEERRPNNRY